MIRKTLVILITAFVAVVSSCTSGRPHYNIGVNTHLVPFSYRTSANELKGIDIDIIDAIAQEMDFTYSLTEVTFSDFINRLQDNTVDGVIAAITVTDERKEFVDYSIPYFETGIEIIANGNDSRINDLSDLEGLSVGVLEGSTMCTYAEDNCELLGISDIVRLESSDMVNKYLLEGKVDIAVSEIPVVRYLNSNGFKFKSIYSFVDSDYAFAVKRNSNRELLQAYNIGFAKIVSNGKYRQIIEKYYK